MNDCIFAWIGACDGETCTCKSYISGNSEKGRAIDQEYSSEVTPIIQEAIKPIRDKYREKYFKGENKNG